MRHVDNVKCPECGRTWTGEFEDKVPDEAVCKDCVRKNPQHAKDHKDVHINKAYKDVV